MTDTPRPNFLVVGAAKAGTSSLWDWLDQHPDVYMARVKEPGFFMHGYGFANWDEYCALFAAGRGRRRIGEASAGYLAAPESARWIRDTLGPVKIIIVLRNPAQRAFSLHGWMVMEGYEPLENFEDALAAEPERIASERFRREASQYFADYHYVATGFYFEQVQRYLDAFGPENVFVGLFDDLVKEPAVFYAQVCGFLGLPEFSSAQFTARNPSVRPRSIPWQGRLRRARQRLEARFGRWSKPARLACAAAMRLNLALGAKKSLAPATKAMLVARFRDDTARLSALIGRDLSPWLQV